MDGETKSGCLPRQSDRPHPWKDSVTGRPRLKTVSLTTANMCQETIVAKCLDGGERMCYEYQWRRERTVRGDRSTGPGTLQCADEGC